VKIPPLILAFAGCAPFMLDHSAGGFLGVGFRRAEAANVTWIRCGGTNASIVGFLAPGHVNTNLGYTYTSSLSVFMVPSWSEGTFLWGLCPSNGPQLRRVGTANVSTSAPAIVHTMDQHDCKAVFYRQVDGTIAMDWGAWKVNDCSGLEGNPKTIKGTVTSGPAATSWSSQGKQRYDLFAVGTRGKLMHNRFSGSIYTSGTWTGWKTLTTGRVHPGSDPAATSMRVGRIDVFVRGTDNQLYWHYYNGIRWSRWIALGGNLTTSPAVSANATTQTLVVYAKFADDRIHFRTAHDPWGQAGWSPWDECGSMTFAPTSKPVAQETGYVAARGTDNALWLAKCPP